MSSTTESPATAATTPLRIEKSSIDNAVTALLKYKSAQSANEKPQLLPKDDFVYLNLTLKKLPSNPRTNPYRIPLPHPILDAGEAELCLIIDDRTGTTTPPSDQIKKLVKSQSIPISKVIKLSKLKSNYKPFEGKRKLCDSYYLFLVDKRIVHLLPKLLGKEFFKKKKLPLGVDLAKKNLKLQVERALGSALLYIRTGTCCMMKVGKVEMEKDDIVDNIVGAINGAVEKIPKKWDGVRSLHLKFSDSVALPVYQAMPDVRLKIEGLKEISEASEVAEISDNDDGKGMSGKKKKTKGRIHEVRYMDVGEDVNSDLDGMDEKMEEDLVQRIDDDGDESKKSDNEELRVDESVGKKRGKSKAKREGVSGDLNGTKVEKHMKSEGTGGRKRKRKSELDLDGMDEKMEEDLMQKIDDDVSKKSENEELRVDESVGKKSGKAKAQSQGVSGDLNGKKTVKKNMKSEETGEGKTKRKSDLGIKLAEGIDKVKDVKKKRSKMAK